MTPLAKLGTGLVIWLSILPMIAAAQSPATATVHFVPAAHHVRELPALSQPAPLPTAVEWSVVKPTEASYALLLDWLNWRPSRSGLHYAASGLSAATLGSGQIHAVQPGHEFGYRVGLLRQTSAGLDYGFRYTNFDATSVDRANRPAADLTATRIHADATADLVNGFPFAAAEFHLDYDVFDWEFGHPHRLGPQAMLRPFAALRFASVDQTMATTYAQSANLAGDVVRVHQSALMDAGGLMAGADGRWRISRGVSLTARMSAGLLAGKSRRLHFEFEPDDNDINVDLSYWSRRVVGVWEATAAVSIEQPTRWGDLEIQFGYDIQSWSNIADFSDFPDDVVDGKLTGEMATLGLEGFYVRSVLAR